jgi:hypothetical protein
VRNLRVSDASVITISVKRGRAKASAEDLSACWSNHEVPKNLKPFNTRAMGTRQPKNAIQRTCKPYDRNHCVLELPEGRVRRRSVTGVHLGHHVGANVTAMGAAPRAGGGTNVEWRRPVKTTRATVMMLRALFAMPMIEAFTAPLNSRKAEYAAEASPAFTLDIM